MELSKAKSGSQSTAISIPMLSLHPDRMVLLLLLWVVVYTREPGTAHGKDGVEKLFNWTYAQKGINIAIRMSNQ